MSGANLSRCPLTGCVQRRSGKLQHNWQDNKQSSQCHIADMNELGLLSYRMKRLRFLKAQAQGTMRSSTLLLSFMSYAMAADSSSQYAAKSILSQYEGFIRVQQGKFVDSNCQQFPVTGVNTYAPQPCDVFELPHILEYEWFFCAGGIWWRVLRVYRHTFQGG